MPTYDPKTELQLILDQLIKDRERLSDELEETVDLISKYKDAIHRIEGDK